MKNKICPDKISCWRYDASNCDGCAVGDKFIRQRKRIARLEEENAALRERLEKSVDRLKAREKSVCFGTEWKAVVTDEDIDEVFGVAEARLAELKGEMK